MFKKIFQLGVKYFPTELVIAGLSNMLADVLDNCSVRLRDKQAVITNVKNLKNAR